MRRREEIQMSGYYHDLVERGFNVNRGQYEDFEKQQTIRSNEDELVYHLARTSIIAGTIRFTPAERISGSRYLFNEQMNGEFSRQREVALLFGHAALLDFEMSQAYDGDLELGANRDDKDSIRTYKELGFGQTRLLASMDERIVMLRSGMIYRRSSLVRREGKEL
ncbi:hypothetical protein H7X69_02730 [Candidatus Saccharibacteria bacterium]|nr:hypothetical protein [Candidatus Saccharibacteria bacterium]